MSKSTELPEYLYCGFWYCGVDHKNTGYRYDRYACWVKPGLSISVRTEEHCFCIVFIQYLYRSNTV